MNRGLKKEKPTKFSMLMCRFNEFRGNIEFDDFEREFEFKKSYIRLSKTKKRVHFEDFIKNKDNQVENIKKSPRRKYKWGVDFYRCVN